jgi:hypothetical protein
MELLLQVLSAFDKISLIQMQDVKLMDRQESKFLIKRNDLLLFLKDLPSDYFVFSIENKEVLAYHTEYYDTPDLDFYRAHLTGKSNRLKVRIRNYVDSRISFIEIKKKNNKGRTTKSRREFEGEFPLVLEKNDANYVKENGYEKESSLIATLSVFYKRITLVSKKLNERVTIDLDLRFTDEKNSKHYEDVCIIEVKQFQKSSSPIFIRLNSLQNLKEPISKYCLGMHSLRPMLPYNLFKTKLYHLNKLRISTI